MAKLVTDFAQIDEGSYEKTPFLKLPEKGEMVVYLGETIQPIVKATGKTYNPVSDLGMKENEIEGGLWQFTQIWASKKTEDGKVQKFPVQVFPELGEADKMGAFVKSHPELFDNNGKTQSKYRILVFAADGNSNDLKPYVWEFTAPIAKKLHSLVMGELAPIENEKCVGWPIKIIRTQSGKQFNGKAVSDTDIQALSEKRRLDTLPETEITKLSGLIGNTPDEALDVLRKNGIAVE